nr:GNAT family N-acetyltransferase [uncultured Tolumonas sp.]
MRNIDIIEAKEGDYTYVAALVQNLLIELEPHSTQDVLAMNLPLITKYLLKRQKIFAFLALSEGEPIGVITFHECAAIYAGGVFGEISELYVNPTFRSYRVGELLVNSAIEKSSINGWKRLEVCSPPPDEFKRVIKFYEKNGFKNTGARLRKLIIS